ncbi:MAG: DUF1501 domain-containing protein [Myxococcaceae bacterium]
MGYGAQRHRRLRASRTRIACPNGPLGAKASSGLEGGATTGGGIRGPDWRGSASGWRRRSGSAFHLTLGGFDTHANQKRQHAPLLQQLSEGVSALLDDAAEHGSGSRLVVMTYSEFGRRARENASGGTDHGAGSVAFLAGERVVGGLDGRLPRLDALMEGDVPSSTDFRSLYSAILRDWLGVAPALGQAPVLGVLRPAA